jgi:hypothetical protein
MTVNSRRNPAGSFGQCSIPQHPAGVRARQSAEADPRCSRQAESPPDAGVSNARVEQAGRSDQTARRKTVKELLRSCRHLHWTRLQTSRPSNMLCLGWKNSPVPTTLRTEHSRINYAPPFRDGLNRSELAAWVHATSPTWALYANLTPDSRPLDCPSHGKRDSKSPLLCSFAIPQSSGGHRLHQTDRPYRGHSPPMP